MNLFLLKAPYLKLNSNIEMELKRRENILIESSSFKIIDIYWSRKNVSANLRTSDGHMLYWTVSRKVVKSSLTKTRGDQYTAFTVFEDFFKNINDFPFRYIHLKINTEMARHRRIFRTKFLNNFFDNKIDGLADNIDLCDDLEIFRFYIRTIEPNYKIAFNGCRHRKQRRK